MAKKISGWKTKGMNRDLSVSAFNPEFAFENINLRLSTKENNTLLSWVNEKGTASISTTSVMYGFPIGTAVLNRQLVIFTHRTDEAALSRPDYIYKLEYNNPTKTTMKCTLLYNGNLGFNISNPLETTVSYEAETIQKVYWTDGINQPRLINIVSDHIHLQSNGGDTQFDFVNELQLKETVTVKKLVGASGDFAPGVIQYSFTYYNKNGQETNIFYTSPLLYISNFDRGNKPDDKVKNAFEIKVEGLDTHFEYLRIYSIQRTSINATPLCKRIQDIYIKDVTGNTATYIDTGYSGDSIDPTELLYKGGEAIMAETLEQKDNTLFLGNIKRKEDFILTTGLKTSIKQGFSISASTRNFTISQVSEGYYKYGNQLSATDNNSNSVPCGGFKTHDWYRLGIQFQDKTGKWSTPVHIADKEQTNCPNDSSNTITVPTFTASTNNSALLDTLVKRGFRKARAVVVFPGVQDRITLCQGVASQTLFTDEGSYRQSSWFFRPWVERGDRVDSEDGISVTPTFGEIPNKPSVAARYLAYTQRNIGNNYPDGNLDAASTDLNNFIPIYKPEEATDYIGAGSHIRAVEVQGDFKPENRFQIDQSFLSLHSPDLEFDDQLKTADFTGTSYKQVGVVVASHTMSDIDIQTSTATISSTGAGFVHKSFKKNNSYGIVSGLFYDDYSVNDESDDVFKKNSHQKAAMKFMVYPWQKDGSLNNDINRPAAGGTASAELRKKIISNLRYCSSHFLEDPKIASIPFATAPQLYSSEEPTILKVGNELYMGNVDTLLIPDRPDGVYFAFDGIGEIEFHIIDTSVVQRTDISVKYNENETSFNSKNWGKTFSLSGEEAAQEGLYMYEEYNDRGQHYTTWARIDDAAGEEYIEMTMKKGGVRMKYKSTPHLVMQLNEGSILGWNEPAAEYSKYTLPIVEIRRNKPSQIFGGDTPDALRENNWIPCGEPVSIVEASGSPKVSLSLNYDYGDTYYQRWDCLKTYAFTPEDKNQVVEIGSFMLETHVNIDGRYDRNRGQQNNLYMSPLNFNLLNPVYSQTDNFFTYKILDDEYYKNLEYPNQITWSNTKTNGADVDAWTNVTLASILEMDGDKGKITSLQRYNDQLLVFQDSGLGRVMFNEQTMISTTEGVPIEIANSGKVQGDIYISDTVGCSNKWSIVSTPMGLYFMDSNDKSIYIYNGQIQNLSTPKGFNSWCKQKIPSSEIKWDPSTFMNFIGCYDKLNQDVLYINKEPYGALAFSEILGNFTSFYSYEDTPFFCNLDDTGVWIKPSVDNRGTSTTTDDIWYTNLWKHNAGTYCNFFGTQQPFWTILVGNPEPQMDKIFTNLEFRACVDGEGSSEAVPYLPFSSLETWNEYQHGITTLNIRNGHDAFKHHDGSISSLKRKFRIWRCDIPRDNAALGLDAGLNITRFKTHPNDRMRNPWLYLKLMKSTSGSALRTEVHDIVMTYFD